MKTSTWIFIGAIFVLIAYLIGRFGYTVNEENRRSTCTTNKEDNNTRNQIIDALTELGCNIEIQEDSTIFFKYQGNAFFINTRKEDAFISIGSRLGYLYSEDPDINDCKQVINQINTEEILTAFYFVNEKDSSFNIVGRKEILFNEYKSNINLYLKDNLEFFFEAKQDFIYKLEKIAEEREAKNTIEEIITKGSEIN